MKVSVLCPAIRVCVQIGSKMLDDFKMFSGFVLRALFEGFTVADIDAVIGLGETVVTEEIDYLQKIGFILSEENTFSVSGKSFYTLMSAVDTVNEHKIDAYVELFSGKILPYKPDIFVDRTYDNNGTSLKKNVYLSSLYERDYGETKKFVTQHYSHLFEGTNEKQRESIYTQLEFVKESEGFIRLTLGEIPSFDCKIEHAQNNCIGLRHNLLHIKWTAENPKLEKYRSDLELLKTLSCIEDGILISSFGHDILEQKTKEREFNHQIQPLVYDNFLREFVDFVPSSGDEEYDIELPQQIDVSFKQWQNSCKDYFSFYIEQNILRYSSVENPLKVAMIVIDKSYYVQRILFDLFLSNLFEQDESEE